MSGNPLTLSHHAARLGDFRHCSSEDKMFLIHHLILQKPRAERVMEPYEWEPPPPPPVSHHPVIFATYGHCGSKDVFNLSRELVRLRDSRAM